jgi:methyltransferase-like protein
MFSGHGEKNLQIKLSEIKKTMGQPINVVKTYAFQMIDGSENSSAIFRIRA